MTDTEETKPKAPKPDDVDHDPHSTKKEREGVRENLVRVVGEALKTDVKALDASELARLADRVNRSLADLKRWHQYKQVGDKWPAVSALDYKRSLLVALEQTEEMRCLCEEWLKNMTNAHARLKTHADWYFERLAALDP